MADTEAGLLREFVEQGCISEDAENMANSCFYCCASQPWRECPKEGVTHAEDCLYARARALLAARDGVVHSGVSVQPGLAGRAAVGDTGGTQPARGHGQGGPSQEGPPLSARADGMEGLKR